MVMASKDSGRADANVVGDGGSSRRGAMAARGYRFQPERGAPSASAARGGAGRGWRAVAVVLVGAFMALLDSKSDCENY